MLTVKEQRFICKNLAELSVFCKKYGLIFNIKLFKTVSRTILTLNWRFREYFENKVRFWTLIHCKNYNLKYFKKLTKYGKCTFLGNGLYTKF